MNMAIQDIIKSKNVTNPEVVKYLQDANTHDQFCEYAQWAYIESVQLNNNLETVAKVPCDEIMKQKALTVAKYENSSAHNVTTNEMRLTMQKSFQIWNDQFKNGKSKRPKDNVMLEQQELLEKKKGKLSILEGTAGTESPNYYMFWTNPQYLEQLALSIGDKDQVTSMLPFTPSSTIILELFADDNIVFSATELSVKLYINDQEVKTPYCGNASSCKVADFITAIGKTVNQLSTDALCKQ